MSCFLFMSSIFLCRLFDIVPTLAISLCMTHDIAYHMICVRGAFVCMHDDLLLHACDSSIKNALLSHTESNHRQQQSIERYSYACLSTGVSFVHTPVWPTRPTVRPHTSHNPPTTYVDPHHVLRSTLLLSGLTT